MKKIQFLAVIAFLGLSFSAFSQGPGGRRAGGGPEEMIKREKQALYEKVEDLNSDQKLLLDGIYEEFQVTLEETMKELRSSGTREGMREKMETLRAEKDALIRDVLNEDQYAIYESISKPRARRKEQESGQNSID
ncbi:hypothetical protein MATR_11340 [Marivirga tractuosa]|uniref:Secreted protein n=1 Tax=Marivirga tractuosa (strain ATCC 23168 / DSM 4126 / NBRC 15989 / NCIMB 1408 / VKM B-1430 / H-43) TaxID=643867 RepID=E4TKS1_MARTH|nr:hypothetical protein [Marivirga tractuosa]ADR21237.1 hypothetical protein Ftrac_1246 [Marivirga tractuosa DSM 4126]BDD14309.1 hypothetical protein MATR_11340 [Marivirga tractuosa]